MRFEKDGAALICARQGEKLRLEPWGRDALRIRATMKPGFGGGCWALTEPVPEPEENIVFYEEEHREGDGEIRRYPAARITNGRLSVTVNRAGVMSFYRDGALFLREYYRNYGGSVTKESHCLKTVSREWVPYVGGDWRLTVRYEPMTGKGSSAWGSTSSPIWI